MARCVGLAASAYSSHLGRPPCPAVLRVHGLKTVRQCKDFASFNIRPAKTLQLSVRAQASSSDEDGGDGGNRPYGLGGPGTFFGFGRSQERFVGRFAMIGFAAGVVMEVVTGKGVFGQLGIDPLTIRYPFLLGFLFLVVAGLLGGYVVIKNPPDEKKAPPNAGAGVPRDPLKTFDAKNMETMTTYTRGGVVDRPSGQKGREPYVSDLELPDNDKE